jgi:hypothetical protein
MSNKAISKSQKRLNKRAKASRDSSERRMAPDTFLEEVRIDFIGNEVGRRKKKVSSNRRSYIQGKIGGSGKPKKSRSV